MTAITVTIGATPYPSYADVATADAYLAADVERATAWATADATSKARGLASATRLMQRLPFSAGVPATDTTAVPADVVAACCLLAADLAADPSVQSNPSTGSSNVKAVGAGPARVEFFKPVRGAALPPLVWDLLKPFLDGGASSAAFGAAYGTDVGSALEGDDYERGSFY